MLTKDGTVLQTIGLSKRYGQRTILSDVNLVVPEGAILGFLGANGAGKTTTMRTIVGLVRPSSGHVQVLGQDTAATPGIIAQNVGAMIEEPGFYGYLSANANLQIMARISGLNPDKNQIDHFLEQVGLRATVKQPVKTFSTGMKQRLGIACILLNSPKLIILDEPLNGLDPAGVLEIRNLMKALCEAGHTIVFSSHQLSEVEQVATHIAVIHRGKIVTQEKLDVLLNQSPLVKLEVSSTAQVEQALNSEFQVQIIDDRWLTLPASKANVPRILSLLSQHQIDVFQIFVDSNQLERLFLDLTRDDATGPVSK